MVPVRVRLAGFLSYREPQELGFDGARRWLLAGQNGSGKSGLFDAITWALFGQHRGGSRNVGELIHKDRARCDVEFDFRIGESQYRIDRSLRRSRDGATGTQAIYERVGHEWHPITDTTRKTEFDDWIASQIGLNYEAFCALSLLRQCRTEQFLDDTSKGRAEVLANVIGLERYERLQQRALQEMQKCRAVLDAMHVLTESEADVSVDDLENARRQLTRQEPAASAARQAIDALEESLQAAHRWSALEERRRTIGDRIASAAVLLANAAMIERENARHVELAKVVPVVERMLAARGKFSDSEQRMQRFQIQQEAVQRQKEILDREVTAIRLVQQTLKKRVASDEVRIAALVQRRAALAAALKTQQWIDEQLAESQRLQAEMKQYPDDLPERLQNASKDNERLERLIRQLPLIERLLAEQWDLVETQQRIGRVAETMVQIRCDGEAARVAHEESARRPREVSAELALADETCGESELAAQIAHAAVREMESLRGEPYCRHCGQSLTPEHYQEEADRRAIALAEAERIRGEARSRRDRLRENMAGFQHAESESNERLQRLRLEYQEQSRLKAALDESATRYQTAIAQLQSAVDIEFRNRPLAELKIEATRSEELRRKVQQLTADRDAWQSLQQQIRNCTSTVERLTRSQISVGTIDIRCEQQRLATEEENFAGVVKAGKQALENADRELDAVARRQHEALAEATDLSARLRGEETTREKCREIIESELQGLTPDWQMRVESAGLTECVAWKNAFEELSMNNIGDQFRQLEIARGGLQLLQDEVRELDDTLAAIPEPQRASVEEVEVRLAAAKLQWQIAEAALAECRMRIQHFTERQHRQNNRDARRTEVQREYDRWKRLAELLGRDGLQRRLLRDTQRAIVARANCVLKRLSGSRLTLSLADLENADLCLEMQAIHAAASGRPIGVAFLSGSQRSRVTLALALGLGELRGGRMQCLMIDEAFGNLDVAGRAALIEELHTLPLERLLVVSHDESVVTAFENSYRFELVDGATQVTRIGAATNVAATV